MRMKKFLAVTGGLVFAGTIVTVLTFKVAVVANFVGFLTYCLFH